MERKLRTVLVGCGAISHTWLTAARQNPAVEIVGLVDLNEEAAKVRKDEFGLQNALVGSDLEKMLDLLKPDVVFDATVPEAHVDVTLTALAHGCHVLGEKPLADSMVNARRMVEAARAAGKIYAVTQNRRYDPRIRGFKDFIASGKIGKLTTLNSDFYIGAHFGGYRDHMRHVLLLDMAIHTFDQARLISGADPVAVYCKEWNPSGSWFDYDASAVAIFEMTDGLIYTYRGSWCAEGLNTSWESEWRAVCEHGSASWDGRDCFRAQVVVETGKFHSTWEDIEIRPSSDAQPQGHQGVMNEFVDCILHGGTPQTAASDNIKSLAMVFGAIESAMAGTRVEIKI